MDDILKIKATIFDVLREIERLQGLRQGLVQQLQQLETQAQQAAVPSREQAPPEAVAENNGKS